jgi:hypothetical protein
MIGVALAVIVLGLIVILIFPIIGIAIAVIGVLLLIGLLVGRSRRSAAESGAPGPP